MSKIKQIFFVLLLALALICLYLQVKSCAFTIPDIAKLGTRPEIKYVDPPYFIPGKKATVIGKNFFGFPKSANVLKLNKKKVRIVSASDTVLEFIVPNVRYGNARLELYTSYIGYKSETEVYPKEGGKLEITFEAPFIDSFNTRFVKPGEEILIYGEFDTDKQLFLDVNGNKKEAKIISEELASFLFPEQLPYGPFKLHAFYRKKEIIKSAPTQDFLFFNVELGIPAFFKLEIPENIFTSISEVEIPIMAKIFFNSGVSFDVTNYSVFKILGPNVISLNENNHSFSIKDKGSTEIKAEYFWEPSMLRMEDKISITIDVPSSPELHEVIISEVFPFASGFFQDTDANMDGFARSTDDFIELQNLTEKILDLSTCKFFINEDIEPKIELNKETFIQPYSYHVIFGDRGKEEGLNLSHSGGVIELVCENKTIDYVAYPKGKMGSSSWQRLPNLGGFEKHPVTLFSPGASPPTKPVTLGIDVLSEQDEPDLTHAEENENLNVIEKIVVVPEELKITSKEPHKISVSAVYKDGESFDVSSSAVYEIIEGKNLIHFTSEGFIAPLFSGEAKIKITYEGKQTELKIIINLPSEVKSNELIINEILAAPDKDVNLDGVYKSDGDEFVEIVNVSGKELDISGLIISDKTKVRHVIPAGTVLKNLEPLVIFGSGLDTALQSNIKIQYASTGTLGLNNTDPEEVSILTASGEIIDKVSFDNLNLKGISLNRSQDLNFIEFKPHNELSTVPYSPGLRIDGTGFWIMLH